MSAVVRVSLGRVVATPNALSHLTSDDISAAMSRHQSGNWGDSDKADRRENDRALVNGLRLLSSYRTQQGETLWIITEADRSATTILMPEDY